MKEETPNDGYGGGFGGASSRRQAEYFKGLHAMYERDEADRRQAEYFKRIYAMLERDEAVRKLKLKQLKDKLDKLLDK